MDWWLFTFFIGAILSLFLSIVPTLFYLFLIILLAIAMILYKPLRKTSGLLFGMTWMLFNGWQYQHQWQVNQLNPLILAKTSHRVEGEVLTLSSTPVSEPFHLSKSPDTLSTTLTIRQRFNFKIKRLNHQGVIVPFVVRLSWENAPFKLAQGQHVILNVKFKPAHGMENKGGFSYKTWLRSHDIIATGYVINRLSKSRKAKTQKLENQKNSSQKNDIETNEFKNHALQKNGIYISDNISDNIFNNISDNISENTINKVSNNDISWRQQLYDQYKALLYHSDSNNTSNTQGLSHTLSPLLLALGFGDRSQFTTQMWQILQNTGTGHLIAISGLHIGLVATGSFILLLWLIRLLPLHLFIGKVSYRNKLAKRALNPLLSLNMRYFAILFSLSIAFFYGYLAGFSLPTIRALIMIMLYWLARLVGIKLSLTRWFLLTLFIIVLIKPFSLITGSFWLSCYAVLVIFIATWRYKQHLQSNTHHAELSRSLVNKVWFFLKGLVIIQLVLLIALMPLSALLFQQISVVAFAANVVAVPLMSFIIIPLTLFSLIFLPISHFISLGLSELALECLSGLWVWLTYLNQFSWAKQSISSTHFLWLFAFTFFAIFYVLCFRHSVGLFPQKIVINRNKTHQEKRKVAANLSITFVFTVVFFLAISLSVMNILGYSIWEKTASIDDLENKQLISKQSINKPLVNKSLIIKKSAENPWQLVMLDVGQGLSVLIIRNDRAILYDVGASYPSGFNMADAVIYPYLRHRGITSIDKVIISHDDNDHAGSFERLTALLDIKEVITNIELNAHDKKKNSQAEFIRSGCDLGDEFIWQGLSFKVLSPNKKAISTKDNDKSCVIELSDGQHKVLLTGDISKKVEKQLLTRYPKLTTDILIVPHHGSNTSSSEHFLTTLSPQLALVSAGYLNRWKMPTQKVVNRYDKLNIPLINTAEVGEITLLFSDKEMIKLQTYHDDYRPFWFVK